MDDFGLVQSGHLASLDHLMMIFWMVHSRALSKCNAVRSANDGFLPIAANLDLPSYAQRPGISTMDGGSHAPHADRP
jgi:hypothetical protein